MNKIDQAVELLTKLVEDNVDTEERVNKAIDMKLVRKLEIEKIEIDDKDDDPYYMLNMVIPEAITDKDGNLTLIDSKEEGIAYGNYIAEAIEEYMNKNPNEEPIKIFRSILHEIDIMMEEAAKKMNIKPEDIFF